MIARTTASLSRSASIAHPTNAGFGLRGGNSRSIVSSELKVNL